MTLRPTDWLYVALSLYGTGTLFAVGGTFAKQRKAAQEVAFAIIATGFAAHTIFIGTICVRTGHPPLMNLAEVASFIAWTILLIEMAIHLRLRIYAAAVVVYPLAFALLLVAAAAGDSFARAGAAQRSPLFTAHVLMSTLGIALLFIGLGFSLVATAQHRSLKAKKQGRLWDWIPSLAICTRVSDRALAAGLGVYTAGLATGLLWSFRSSAVRAGWGAKQAGAIVAWALFAVLVQSHFTGLFSARRATLALSAAAFIAVVISIFGIAHA